MPVFPKKKKDTKKQKKVGAISKFCFLYCIFSNNNSLNTHAVL